MNVMGLKAIQKRKFKKTTDSNHNLPLKKNLLNRNFIVTQPNKSGYQTSHIYQLKKAGFI